MQLIYIKKQKGEFSSSPKNAAAQITETVIKLKNLVITLNI